MWTALSSVVWSQWDGEVENATLILTLGKAMSRGRGALPVKSNNTKILTILFPV